jgi:hypothetical protein
METFVHSRAGNSLSLERRMSRCESNHKSLWSCNGGSSLLWYNLLHVQLNTRLSLHGVVGMQDEELMQGFALAAAFCCE